jgi:hypothetical protein
VNPRASMTAIRDAALLNLQRATFRYFLNEVNPLNGLVRDSTHEGAPSSITAVGLGLATYAVGAECGFLPRKKAVRRTLTTLRFFWNSAQGEERDATGYKGFYHFLDMQTGRRAWRSELSTIDTTFLLAGMLTAAAYFDRENPEEREIRKLANAMYRRADWQWALNGGAKRWHSKGYYGLDQGPIVLMIENYRTGLLWRLMRQCPYILRRAAPGKAGCSRKDLTSNSIIKTNRGLGLSSRFPIPMSLLTRGLTISVKCSLFVLTVQLRSSYSP